MDRLLDKSAGGQHAQLAMQINAILQLGIIILNKDRAVKLAKMTTPVGKIAKVL